MGVATFAGQRFRIDPLSVSWNFETKTNDFPTVGGKVIQVYGTNVTDMTVIGEFGKGGWQQQLQFLQRMKEIASAQAATGKVSRSSTPPARFIYPPKKWDFLVYLSAYDSPTGGKAVRHHNTEISPKWRLTLFIVDDMSDLGIKTVAQDAYVARLSRGIGWKKTAFNGPLEFNPNPEINVVNNAAQDVDNHPSQVAGNTGSSTSFIPDVEQWRSLVAQYFPAKYVNQALSVMQCESRGNPNARNPITLGSSGNAMGLFQHLTKYFPERATAAGFPGASPYDPEANVAASAYLFKQTNDWRHWSCKPKVF